MTLHAVNFMRKASKIAFVPFAMTADRIDLIIFPCMSNPRNDVISPISGGKLVRLLLLMSSRVREVSFVMEGDISGSLLFPKRSCERELRAKSSLGRVDIELLLRIKICSEASCAIWGGMLFILLPCKSNVFRFLDRLIGISFSKLFFACNSANFSHTPNSTGKAAILFAETSSTVREPASFPIEEGICWIWLFVHLRTAKSGRSNTLSGMAANFGSERSREPLFFASRRR